MEEIEYKIFNPGGNKTALVYNKNYSKEEKKKINDSILAKYTDVEQVGFIEKNRYYLEMAGGEFCVNATRCAVYEYLKGENSTIEIMVSGLKEKAIGEIINEKVSLRLEIDKCINEIYELFYGNYLIKLDGIDLIVFSKENSKRYIYDLKKDEEKTKQELKSKMLRFKSTQKAEGIILLEGEEENLKINPIIWVKEIDTVYYETACGSGSLAVAIYQFLKKQNKKISILQPSGYWIDVKLNIENNFLRDAKISGIVEKC